MSMKGMVILVTVIPFLSTIIRLVPESILTYA